MFFEVAASIISFGEGKVIRNLNSQGNKVESKSDMLRYYFVTLLMAILILFVRSFDSFIHPISGWEDTTEGLNYYTSTGATILHSYAGYVSFLPNIVDWMLIKFLPLQAVPFGQAYFALLAAAAIAPATASFFRKKLGWGRLTASGGAIAVACLPWGDVAAVSSTEFSIWSLLAILVFMAGSFPGPSVRAKLVYLIWRVVIITSSPLSIICLPVWFASAWKARRLNADRLVFLSLSMTTVTYIGYCISQPTLLQTSPFNLLTATYSAIRLATEKSLMSIVFREVFRINFTTLPIFWDVLVLAATVILLLRATPKTLVAQASVRWGIFYLLSMMGAAVLVCSLARGIGSALVLMSPRYHYIPQMLWLAIFTILIAEKARAPGKFSRPLIFITVICAILIWQKGWKSYQSNNAESSDRLLAFLHKAQMEHSNGNLQPLRLKRNGSGGDWSVDLFARTAPDPSS